MSVRRTLDLICDGGCGLVIVGADPRYGVRSLRRRARGEGWAVAQGATGGPGRDVCPACLARALTPAQAQRVAKRVVA